MRSTCYEINSRAIVSLSLQLTTLFLVWYFHFALSAGEIGAKLRRNRHGAKKQIPTIFDYFICNCYYPK